MKRRHKFINTRKADERISDAFDYYESKKKGVGKYFFKKLDECIDSIDINPYTYKKNLTNTVRLKLIFFLMLLFM